jgi:hypothetical protein
VSVVVPVRDRRRLLRLLLDALAAQTYSDFEVVVVDDGSTDGSADEAELGAGAVPVRVLRRDGAGAVAARQAGVAAARGSILAFTDSDCIPEPAWLEAGVAAIDAGADGVQGHTRSARRRGLLERSLWVVDQGLFPTCNMFFRRAAFDRAGGFDAGADTRLGFRPGERAKGLGFGEDTLLGWRVRRAGTVAYARDAVVRHEVLPFDPADHLSRTLQAAAFPALVREIPELRRTFLVGGVFLGPSRPPLWAAVAALLLRRRSLAAALAGVWLVRLWRGTRSEPDLARRAKALPVLAATDVVTGAALAVGSVRARTPVL